ncbi:hypothetical protein TorRG33x02_053990 [Trema orientale]|uniref:Uncharacterized protein n=1 Tax=Trema orientale TaxID=63057 RepID=A0A2P5FLX8_TREOI|nr:hypothetical protein TorRG33x02_053990 [Trema orientale]
MLCWSLCNFLYGIFGLLSLIFHLLLFCNQNLEMALF